MINGMSLWEVIISEMTIPVIVKEMFLPRTLQLIPSRVSHQMEKGVLTSIILQAGFLPFTQQIKATLLSLVFLVANAIRVVWLTFFITIPHLTCRPGH